MDHTSSSRKRSGELHLLPASQDDDPQVSTGWDASEREGLAGAAAHLALLNEYCALEGAHAVDVLADDDLPPAQPLSARRRPQQIHPSDRLTRKTSDPGGTRLNAF